MLIKVVLVLMLLLIISQLFHALWLMLSPAIRKDVGTSGPARLLLPAGGHHACSLSRWAGWTPNPRPTGTASKRVDKRRTDRPDHIDEVPIPGRNLESEMTLWGEMIPQHDAQPDDGQEKGAQQHVQSMEPGQNEEGIAIDAGISRSPRSR